MMAVDPAYKAPKLSNGCDTRLYIDGRIEEGSKS